MTLYKFGTTHVRPTREQAEAMDDIAREEGADGFTEVNLTEGMAISINNGKYEGWFTSNDKGPQANADLRRRVLGRIKKELGITIY